MSGIKEKAASGFAYVAIYTAAARGIYLLTFSIYLKLLEPEDLGIFSLGMVLVTGLVMFREMGFTPALMQIQEDVERAFRSAAAAVPILGILVYIIIFFSAPLFGYLVNNPQVVPVVRALGLIAPITAFGVVPSVYLQRYMLFRKKVVPEILSVILASIIGLALAYNGYGVWSITASLVFTELFRTIFFWFAAGFIFRPLIDFEMWTRLIKFGYHVSFGSVSSFLYSLIDQFAIGRVFGTAMLGFYSVAMKLNNLLPTNVVILSNQVMLALLSSLQNDAETFVKAYKKGLTLFAMVSVPVAAGIFMFSGDILHLLYGNKWDEAVIYMKIFALYGLARAVGEINGEVFFSKAQPKYFKYQGMSRLIAACIFLPLALMAGSMELVALLFTGILVLTVLIAFHWASKLMGKNILTPLSVFVPHLAGIAGGAAASYISHILSGFRLLDFILFFTVYAAVFYLVAKQELIFIYDFLRKKFSH